MLRLRPSELALTPDDVDETFRRIALRQASRARQQWTMRPVGQPNRPILRRGPQRAVRNAMTPLSNVPILQPQQTISASVDDDDEGDGDDEEAAQPAAHDNGPAAPLHPTHERNSATVSSPAASAPHAFQLPLRLRTVHQPPEVQTASYQQPEGTSHTPRRQLPGPARPESTRRTGNNSEQPSQLRPVDTSANTPGLRGGGSLAILARAYDIDRDAFYARLPLNQIQQLSSTSPAQQVVPGDPTKSPNSPSTGHGALHKSRCSDQTPRNTPHVAAKCLSNSEPRRGSGRQPAVTRSLSSGNAPSSSVTCQSASPPEGPSRNVFGTSATTETPCSRRRGSSNLDSRGDSAHSTKKASRTLGGSMQASAGPDDHGSRATSASTAYSWYGSLGSDTRFPSSEHSQNEASPPQLDGVRAGSHRLSPLPSMPYTRTQNDSALSSSLSPASGLFRQGSASYIEASTAITHALRSPLDPYAEHYARRQQAQNTPPNFRPYASASIASVGGWPADASSPDWGPQPGNQARLEPGPERSVSQQQRSPEYPASRSRVFSRASEYPRLEQRSSENAPVSAPVVQGEASRLGTVQAQRAVYERLQSSAQATYARGAGSMDTVSLQASMPQRNTPHDVSNRARVQTPYRSATRGMPRDGDEVPSPSPSRSPYGVHEPRQPSPSQSPDVVGGGSPRPSRQQRWRQDSPGSAGLAGARVYEGASGGRRLQPRRDVPLSALASFEQSSGTMSRRTHAPLVRAGPTTAARTLGRVRPEQRDQENEGDGIMMQREEDNVAARYGDEAQQRTTMNETPPRIGRVERRMME